MGVIWPSLGSGPEDSEELDEEQGEMEREEEDNAVTGTVVVRDFFFSSS